MNLHFSAAAASLGRARKRLPASAPGVASRPRRALLKGTVSLFALGGCTSAMLSACGGEYTGGGAAQDAPPLVIDSVANFRDVGGTAPGYSTSDGAHVRRGWCYRSDVLTPNAADEATLDGIGLVSVYDLRTPDETNSTPAVVPNTAAYSAINVLGTLAPPSFAGMNATDLDTAMQGWWREFVTGHTQCAAYGTLLTRMASAGGPQLICGSTGVDVVGWASALLLLIANVPLEIIVKDFLLTNAWRATGITATNDAPPVQASYLQAAFDALQSNYGDLNRYLTTGLGLGSETVNTLRAQLVV